MEEKIAIKSGYYFKIFDKEQVNIELEKTNRRVKYNDNIYNIYRATTLEDERKVDELFGNDMGNSIDEFEVKKPKCALIGQDGNIFNLMGIASRTLKQNGMREESEEMVNRITNSHSYYDAIAIIGEYVDISDNEYEDEDEEDYYDDEEFE